MEKLIEAMIDRFVEELKSDNPELNKTLDESDLEYCKEVVISECLHTVDEYIGDLDGEL